MILEGPSVPEELFDKVSEWPEIVRLKAGWCQMQVCTTIPPERKGELNAALVASGLSVSGTSNGWTLDESVEPVECDEAPGRRWHYICVC